MGEYTSRAGLYKPGGGSSGGILPDEVVDVDKINANSDIIDKLLGARSVPNVTSYSGDFPGDLIYDEGTGQLHINSADASGVLPLRVPGGRTFRGTKAQMEAFVPRAKTDDLWEITSTGSVYVFSSNAWKLYTGYGAFAPTRAVANSSGWSPQYGNNATWSKVGGEFDFVNIGADTDVGLKIPESGIYEVAGSFLVAATGNWFFGVKRNSIAPDSAGLIVNTALQVAAAAGTAAASYYRMVKLDKGDRLMPTIWTNNTAGPYGFTPSGSSFSVRKVPGDAV